MTEPTDTDGDRPTSLGHPDDPAYYEVLGRAIRVLRTERGMERKDLAEAAGLSYAYLSEIETGKKRASSKALFVIAEALGVRPSEILALGDRYASLPAASPNQATRVTRATSPPPPAAQPMPAAPSPEAFAGGPPAPPAASASRRSALQAPRWQWFRREEEAPEAAAMSARQSLAPEVAASSEAMPPDQRSELMDELTEEAARLSDEDVQRLIDLARRLGR